MAIDGIHFDVGSDVIRPESIRALATIGDMLREHPTLQVCIEVHTDNVGIPENNRRLSEARALAVVTYLVAKGAEAARVQYKGCGDAQPVAPNDTPLNRQRNRRVELVMQKELSAQ